MTVLGFDHCSFPTADSERCITFYKSLGFEILYEGRWREGKSPVFSVRVGGSSLINVHPNGYTPSLKGQTASPGCGDICFVWDGSVDGVLEMLKQAGVPVLEGPVKRTGGRGAGTLASKSIYIQDPDGNLLEFMVYD